MRQFRLFGVGLSVFLASAAGLSADPPRYYEENGITWRETTRTVLRPVTETHIEERERTVYRQQCHTELRDTYRTIQVPVTEYRCESYWVNRWNPFAQPYLAQRFVPVTRFETRTEVAQVPVVRRELIPEKRVDQVPIISRRMVAEPMVSRVQVPPLRRADPFASVPSMASSQRIGGVTKLESDPPRQSEWRPASEILRR